jgi:hypothetical protein
MLPKRRQWRSRADGDCWRAYKSLPTGDLKTAVKDRKQERMTTRKQEEKRLWEAQHNDNGKSERELAKSRAGRDSPARVVHEKNMGARALSYHPNSRLQGFQWVGMDDGWETLYSYLSQGPRHHMEAGSFSGRLYVR